jgi:hypothetical protein
MLLMLMMPAIPPRYCPLRRPLPALPGLPPLPRPLYIRKIHRHFIFALTTEKQGLRCGRPESNRCAYPESTFFPVRRGSTSYPTIHWMPALHLPCSVKALANLLRSSQITSRALAAKSIDAAGASLHGCFSEIHHEVAHLASIASDKRFAAGTSLGWLDGVPFAIKDNFCTEFGCTTARCFPLQKNAFKCA